MFEKKCLECGKIVSLGDYISHAKKHNSTQEKCFKP